MPPSEKQKTVERAWYGLAAFLIGVCALAALPASAIDENRFVTQLKAGVFLFAVPELRDPNFLHTVVLLVKYEKQGATGLIINRPMEIPLDEVLKDIEGIEGVTLPLYFGGPVSRERMLVLLRSPKPPQGAEKVFEDVYFTLSRDALIETLKSQNPDKVLRVYAGYAGWGAGQLDHEIRRGDWVVAKADPEKVFTEDPTEIWPEIFKIRQQIEVRNFNPLPMPSS
jgi:putative transcriptional regulator